MHFICESFEQIPSAPDCRYIYSRKNQLLGLCFSSSAGADLQRQFLNPQVHNLLQKLVSSSKPAAIHEPNFRVDKEHNVTLLSDAELQAVSLSLLLDCFPNKGHEVLGNVDSAKIADATSYE